MTADSKDWGKEAIQINLTNEEVAGAINLLDFTAAYFEVMIKTAHEHKDLNTVSNLEVRVAFAKLFANKLHESLAMGDNKSRTFH